MLICPHCTFSLRSMHNCDNMLADFSLLNIEYWARERESERETKNHHYVALRVLLKFWCGWQENATCHRTFCTKKKWKFSFHTNENVAMHVWNASMHAFVKMPVKIIFYRGDVWFGADASLSIESKRNE